MTRFEINDHQTPREQFNAICSRMPHDERVKWTAGLRLDSSFYNALGGFTVRYFTLSDDGARYIPRRCTMARESV